MKKITFLILFSSIFLFQHAYTQEKFLSLKKDKVYVRHGPSFNSPIKYIYNKKNLPVKQIDKSDNWIRIIDLKNNSGWINDIMLKSPNSIITLEDKILFKKPTNFSKPFARLEKGRLLVIKKCEDEWCNVTTNNHKGWIKNKNVWGSIK